MTTTTKSPADMLADAGRALYGEHWRQPLARDLGVREDTIRHWMTGRSELMADHPVLVRATALLHRRMQEIRFMADALERLTKGP